MKKIIVIARLSISLRQVKNVDLEKRIIFVVDIYEDDLEKKVSSWNFDDPVS
jgi:hypothetical protein